MNFWSVKKVSREELEIAFESIDWSKALDCTSVDDAATMFVKLFTSAWNSVAPSRLHCMQTKAPLDDWDGAKSHPRNTGRLQEISFSLQLSKWTVLQTAKKASET